MLRKLVGGPSQNSPSVLYHHCIPDPATKEVATSGFGDVCMVLEPPVLPILLAGDHAQNPPIALSLPSMPDLAFVY